MEVQQAYPTVDAGCGCDASRAFPAPQTPMQQGPGQAPGQQFGPGFGPGPFPPFPGPGPFPPFPGPGPFPPFPGPGPFPPSPGPGPFPPFPGQRPVTVFINGGRQFPWLTRSYSIPHRFGLTVRQALAATEVVQFGLSGQIVSVGGVYTGPGSNIRTTVRLNGRELQPGFLNAPVTPGSFISLELSRFFT
ncbi:MAG: hypothetical protein A9Z00_00430 [Thermobacillus sp. ZCTH02-B1]|nr:MAG: hypothetical protein A9Z00_00430 [Thermobacillus sp. ZCTH02-B1]